MTQLAWMTDIHLNFLIKPYREKFYDSIINSGCDGVIISGDIGEAKTFKLYLREMQKYIDKPIYYVLGNHDYYAGSIKTIRRNLFKAKDENIHWLNKGIIKLSNNTILAGADGWADGRYGNYNKSHVVLNDSIYIKELASAYRKGRDNLLNEMKWYADNDASDLYERINECTPFDRPFNVIIATHVPPFPLSAKYRGEVSDENFLPFYASKVMGDSLLDLADKYPQCQFQVFCGHTHGAAIYQPRDNLIVTTGQAHYNYPQIQKLIDIA